MKLKEKRRHCRHFYRTCVRLLLVYKDKEVKRVAKQKSKLPPKQQLFVDEYLIDLNATQAVIRAGYSVKDAKIAGTVACELLAKPNIKRAIAEALAERSKRTGVNQDRVIEELAKIAFVNISDVADRNARIKDDAAPEDLAAIESIKYKQSDTEMGQSVEREVKLASKLKALEMLGKHLGMFGSKVSEEMLQLRREEFEYKKEKEAGAFSEYEDMDGIEQDIYGDKTEE